MSGVLTMGSLDPAFAAATSVDGEPVVVDLRTVEFVEPAGFPLDEVDEVRHALALAVTHKLHVDDLANTYTVYPSVSGSISEAARRLHVHL